MGYHSDQNLLFTHGPDDADAANANDGYSKEDEKISDGVDVDAEFEVYFPLAEGEYG